MVGKFFGKKKKPNILYVLESLSFFYLEFQYPDY